MLNKVEVSQTVVGNKAESMTITSVATFFHDAVRRYTDKRPETVVHRRNNT